MPTQSRLRGLRYRIKELIERDFSGGPNVRDSASELAQNESIDAWNVSFDERGGVGARLGYIKSNPVAYGGGLIQNVWYSTTVQSQIVQAGSSLYLGTGLTIRKTFSTSARVGFADFAGKLCVIHPIDGIFTSTDGITYTVVADIDAPKGTCLYPWQNKLFTAGNPANASRVGWSAAGDPTAWSATDFVDLREKDNETVVALAGASGIDIQGRQGILAFKRRSTYRIFSSSTGEYSTVDTTVGAASAISVVSIGQQTLSLSERGVYFTDGIGPMTEVSMRFTPLWDFTQINFSKLDLFCAGRRGNRAYFSLCRASSTANDMSIEYLPTQGSLGPGSNAMSCYTTYGLNTEYLLGGSPTVTGQAYQMYSGGTDDGTAISSRFQSRWYEPSEGFLCQLWQMRLQMRGSFSVTLRKDYQSYDYAPVSVASSSLGIFYDAGYTYDSGSLYFSPGEQSTVSLFGWGVARQFALRITATSTTTMSGRQLFEQGSPQTLGAWALYGMNALYMPIGWS